MEPELGQWQGEEEGRDKCKDIWGTGLPRLTGHLNWVEGLSHR